MPEDVVSAYHYNASSFNKSRVLYRYLTRYNSKGSLDDSNEKDQSVSHVASFDYWTDFRDVLFRSLPNDETNIILTTPDEITSEDMETIYRHVLLYSYFAEDGISRYWHGYSEDSNIGQAWQGFNILFEQDSNFIFPPFLVYPSEKEPWREEKFYPPDYLFSFPISDIYVLGKAKYNGIDCLIVDFHKMEPSGKYNFTRGIRDTKYASSEINFCDVFRAWIDPQRGYIPIHIECASFLSIDGRPLKDVALLNSFDNPRMVFDVQEIVEVLPGQYYPVTSVRKYFRADPNYLPKDFLSIVEQLEGAQNDYRMILFEKAQWIVFKVKPEVNISTQTIKLPFPKGTELFDKKTRKMNIVGMTDVEYEKMLRDEEEKSRLLVSGCGKNDFDNDAVESNAVTIEKHVVSTTSKPKRINPFKLDIPEKSSEGSLLLFEKCIQDFGEFQCGKDSFKIGSGGGKVEFLFPFKVGKEDIFIEKLDTSCGCVVSDSQLIGQKLLAGTEHSLKFVMDLRGRCGEFFAFANIVIKPEPKEPIMLKMMV